ncbi:hypothetical protein KXD93_14665 [Mucilaginibacter sp. BJC16-A38]|uniref:hypothetical protein n=1 Tax=Mucilaginibacter phenanthrenivorans TaxID=1234842 RepID=UPI002157847F|nr:hypothetical protein [Mucilaginibacter phenanthrenivorans]MCR8558896.1 hypothetical protein [Mucilaginibacter phenanthrenivorans]
MKNVTALELIIKYTQRQCTAEETELVDNWYDSLKDEPDFVSMLSDAERQELKEDLYKKILQKIGLG